jgi:predicted  nucleic acid-binding Zn-ribbon protein
MEPQTQSQEDQIKAGLQTLRDGITQLLERKSRRDVLQEKRQEMLDDLKKEIAEIKGSADVNEADRAAYLMERFEQWTGTIPEEYYDESQDSLFNERLITDAMNL